jgi:hypothetical protein
LARTRCDQAAEGAMLDAFPGFVKKEGDPLSDKKNLK